MNDSKPVPQTKTQAQAKPAPASLLDPRWRYTPAAATDITQTWRRFGWRPISEGNAK